MLPESLNAAYVEAVKACGGSKAVGVVLWPGKGVEGAQRALLACLNTDRLEKLSPDDALHIERMARERGCHVIAQYRNATLSYAEPVPIEPKDELADLMRQYLQNREEDSRKHARLERMIAQHLGVRAAA